MTDSTSNFDFKYNFHEAINMRGKTPFEVFDYIGEGMNKPFDFYTSCNAAQIDESTQQFEEDEFEYIFGRELIAARTLTKEEFKYGMSTYRRNHPKEVVPDLNPGGGAYFM